MALITPNRINELKARVKAECSKRACSNTDFTTTPASGVIVAKEHYDKIATPLNTINSDVITEASGKTLIADGDFTTMEAFVAVLEKREKTDHTGSDCKGSCTGLCYGCVGTCYNACTGCTSCTSCTSCSGCSGCSGTCEGTCSGSCWYWCASDCMGTCSGCSGSCSGQCTGNCTSCTGSCTMYCAATCAGGVGIK